MFSNAITISVSLFLYGLNICQAEIITDGSVGAAWNVPIEKINGQENFAIGQELGTLEGNNLFHSFSQFNLAQGQSATFSGSDPAIQNVISRVTGGSISTIDGTLKSDIGQAAFYFINPAGIVFGEHAKVDVNGAFYASTANELQFADGKTFSANSQSGSSLSMAAPTAFGFLGKQSGTLTVDSEKLQFKTGAAHLSTSDITFNNATVNGSDLQLVAVGDSAIAVPVDALPEQVLQGNISLNNSNITATGSGGGRIAMRAGFLSLDNSSLAAVNNSDSNALNKQSIDLRANIIDLNNKSKLIIGASKGKTGDINLQSERLILNNDSGIQHLGMDKSPQSSGQFRITANDVRLLNRSYIQSSSFNNAWDINIYANTLLLSGNSWISSLTTGNSSSNAGNIVLQVRDWLRLEGSAFKDGNSFIRSFSTGAGNFGDIIIHAGDISMGAWSIIGGSSIPAQTRTGNINICARNLTVDAGDGLSFITSFTSGNMPAGNVSINVQEQLQLIHGGAINANTYGTGNAGKIEVTAGSLLIEGAGSGITSETQYGMENNSNNSTNLNGNAGQINITVRDALELKNTKAHDNSGLDSGISSASFTKGNAGTVEVNANTILVDDAVITSSTLGSSGNAGNVKIEARNELALVNGGSIESSTFAQGNAGTVTVQAEQIKIEGQADENNFTGIASIAGENATGHVGSVSVTASKSLLIDHGGISINSKAINSNSGEFNQLNVTAPKINLTNHSYIDAASTGNAPASAIQIDTTQLTLKGDSQITTSANQGNGGPISINANDWLFLNNSQITTSVTGKDNGNGGDITLNGDVLVMDSGFIQANTTAPLASGGNINLNIKQLVYGQDNLQRGGGTPLTFISNSGLNVIQAASPTGVNGNINISAPQLNIVGALMGLNTLELDLNHVGRDPCSDTMRQSSLKKLGKGGVPMFNKGQDGYTIDHLLDAEPQDVANASHSANPPNGNADCKPKLADKPRQQALTY